MFSGSHRCLRRRAISSLIDNYASTVTASSSSSSGEPLLFLYPRWVSTLVQPSAAVGSGEEGFEREDTTSAGGNGGQDAAKGQRQLRTRRTDQECVGEGSEAVGRKRASLTSGRRRTGFGDGGRRLFSIRGAGLRESMGSARRSLGREELRSESGRNDVPPTVVESPPDFPNTFTSLDQRRSEELNHVSQSSWTRPTKNGESQSTRSPSHPSNASHSYSHALRKEQTSLPPSRPVPIRRISGTSEAVYQKIKRYQANKRKGKTDPYLKSIESLERLSRSSRAARSTLSADQKVIYFSESALNTVTRQSEENKWVIHNRSGCWIHVLGAEESDGLNRKAILSGSPRAIEIAEESIIAALMAEGDAARPSAEQAQFSFVPAPHRARVGGGKGFPVTRGVWTTQRRGRHALRVDQVRPEEVPRPEKWTVVDFAEYVRELTELSIPRSMHRQLYQSNETHVSVTKDILYKLFDDPANVEFFSTKAINLAIEFFYRHRYIPAARSLFPKFMPFLTVDSFNIMLRNIAVSKDIHTFNYFLDLMERLGIQPNGKTWVALVKAIPNSAVRARAISHMKLAGLLDNPSTLHALVTLYIGDEFIRHLASGQDTTSFLKLMDKRWGPGWLSTHAVNQLLSSAVDNGNWEACVQVEKYCREQNLKLTTDNLNNALVYFRKKGRIYDALRTFFHFKTHYGVDADAITIQTLFSTAWRTKRYNLCRVLWRYACMHGTVTWGSQNRILRSLLQNTVSRKQDTWLTTAGKVIVGVDPDPSTLQSFFNLSKDRSPPAHLVGYLPDGPKRVKQRELAEKMLACDLDAVTNFVPKKGLEIMIEEAMERDKEWGELGLQVERDVYWMIQNAVDVPVWRRKGRSGEQRNLVRKVFV